MTRMAIRLDPLEQCRPVPAPRAFDLSRLTDDRLDRVLLLRERIKLVGPEGLTPDEMDELAEMMAILEADTSCLAPC